MGILISDLFVNLPADIRILKSCADEIESIIKGSGIETKFADDFDNRIYFLEKYKKSAENIDKKKFWKMRGYDNLYEIRFKLRPNIRIIYTFKTDREIYLLHSFIERGEADYKKAAKVAIQRKSKL